jgi:hypothetical protein
MNERIIYKRPASGYGADEQPKKQKERARSFQGGKRPRSALLMHGQAQQSP